MPRLSKEKMEEKLNKTNEKDKKTEKKNERGAKRVAKREKKEQKSEKENKKSKRSKDPILEKLEYIGLDLEKPSKILKDFESLKYTINKSYDDKTYKVYRHIPVKDIQLMISPIERMGDVQEKYKYATPLVGYFKPKAKAKAEDLERYAKFLKMLNDTSLEQIKSVENEQELLKENQPFNIKYKDNFMWQIYYSDSAEKYFMLASSEEQNNGPLFYMIKKQIQISKSRNKKNEETIFVPIVCEDYSGKLLKKNEIADMENYIWYFTKNWPQIYEVYDKQGIMTLQIVGKIDVYEKIESEYKIILTNKKEASNLYKLLKALFILSSEIPDCYNYTCKINDNGSIDFYENETMISYTSLSKYIKDKYCEKIEDEDNIIIKIRELERKIEKLKEEINVKTQEYLSEERQIFNFLECRKTFFGKIRYFFKSKKNAKSIIEKAREKIEENEEEKEISESEVKIEYKKSYTIEELINVSKVWKKKDDRIRSLKLDEKALSLKLKNLELKIKNARQYIQEIEEHKKSIFEFWKFANKDEIPSLTEATENEEKDNDKLRKYFDYENDIEDLGKQVDELQRKKLSREETDAIFAIREVIEASNALQYDKEYIDEIISKTLEELKSSYKDNIEEIQDKDFDIFGNLVDDKTKIKVLNATKHREIEKDKYKILNIREDTTIEDFKETIINYTRLCNEAYQKIKASYDFSIYRATTKDSNNIGYEIFNMNPNDSIYELDTQKGMYLEKVNIKENMNILFYSNIIFYDNNNKTLPLGMDVVTQVLFNLSKYELKLINEKEININVYENEYCAKVKKIYIKEYELKECD